MRSVSCDVCTGNWEIHILWKQLIHLTSTMVAYGVQCNLTWRNQHGGGNFVGGEGIVQQHCLADSQVGFTQDSLPTTAWTQRWNLCVHLSHICPDGIYCADTRRRRGWKARTLWDAMGWHYGMWRLSVTWVGGVIDLQGPLPEGRQNTEIHSVITLHIAVNLGQIWCSAGPNPT